MRKAATILVLVSVSCAVSFAEEPYSELVRHFEYDRKVPLDIRELVVQQRDSVKVHDISYASPKGGRVPAYLVVPRGKGPFAAVLLGHWAMPGSPTRNRTEFLEEAIGLARAGAVCLLIDAPFARPGQTEDKDFLSPRNAELLFQEVLDMRRGVDVLLARPDVDPKRIAYVGHSYNASVGGILAGVEKRIKAFVLMATVLSEAELIGSEEPEILKWRAQVDEKRIKEYLATYNWLDPAPYVGHAAPSAVLLQYARKDEFLTDPEGWARRDFDLVSEPKTLKLYDAGHALNAQARRDRFDWLRSQLGLRKVAPGVLDRIPEIR